MEFESPQQKKNEAVLKKVHNIAGQNDWEKIFKYRTTAFFSRWRVSPFNFEKFSILIGCGRGPTASVTTASARKGRSTAKDMAMGEEGTVSM